MSKFADLHTPQRKLYAEFSEYDMKKGEVKYPQSIMFHCSKWIGAFWVLQFDKGDTMRDCVVEVAEGKDTGKIYRASVLVLRRLSQPYIITLLEELEDFQLE